MLILATVSYGIVASFILTVTAGGAPNQLDNSFGVDASGVLRPVAVALGET